MANEKKQYQTAGRRALLSYLKKYTTETPRTAEEIYLGLSCGERAPGRSSVYRMLGELSAAGTVRKCRAEGEGYAYQFVGAEGDCHGHFHLQCLSCGRISHLKCACGTEISAHLLKTHGFLVDCGRSVLFGTCAACAVGGEAHG
ncbi:MAG: transcriptional repressor [Clostridia bacterium]|nr:transcriptional repressor [Clostridia bacterium]